MRPMSHPDPSRPIRTFVKALGWETFSFFLTLGVSYVVVGSASKATELTVILFIVKVAFLFLYERVWHKIRWGKVYGNGHIRAYDLSTNVRDERN